jgi:hypothetical protein
MIACYYYGLGPNKATSLERARRDANENSIESFLHDFLSLTLKFKSTGPYRLPYV